MTAIINTAGSFSAVINNIWEVALLAARENSIMLPLVKQFGPGGGMAGRAWATYTSNTLGTIAESTDTGAVGKVFVPTSAGTLTPYIYADTYILSDMLRASEPFGVAADLGRDIGQQAAVAVDSALVSLLGSLTAGTVGATVTALTWPAIQHASAYIRAQKAPPPYRCVLSPSQWYDLTAGTSGVPTLLQSQDLMREFGQFYMASWAGIDFFVDANITQTGGTVSGGLFSADAIAFDLRRALRIEPQRDASFGGGADELNVSIVFAYGLFRPLFGAKVSGSTAP